MNPLVDRLDTPEECDQFIENVAEKHPEHVPDAIKRKVDLLAVQQNPANECEKACYAAIFAYEEVLYRARGKRIRAARTWQKIKREGLLPAVEAWVLKPYEPTGYTELKDLGLLQYSFEYVIDKFPEHFSEAAVAGSRQRLPELQKL